MSITGKRVMVYDAPVPITGKMEYRKKDFDSICKEAQEAYDSRNPHKDDKKTMQRTANMDIDSIDTIIKDMQDFYNSKNPHKDVKKC